MRKYFVTKILSLMQLDSKIIFLTADLGFGSFEIIQNLYPQRFFNVGIAEQNMVGVACGLALMGKKVIIYSIANFSTLRVLEQIRNYLIYHQTHVLIVNGGAAFSYGQLGYTHHAVEDVSIIKALAEIQILVPFDAKTIDRTIDIWYDQKKVAYLRLEKTEVECITDIQYTSFGAIIGNPKNNKFIISYGTVANEALQVKPQLNFSIILLIDLKNIPSQIYDLINGANSVLFLEENSTHSGLGEHFFATCMINRIKIKKTIILGVKDFISNTIGDQNYLRKIHGISRQEILNFFKKNDA